MENASKALMIAGSILLALMITALLVKNFSDISSFQKTKLTEQEQEQIVEFNEQYTKYLNGYVYGAEVYSLLNKYANDNKVAVNVIGEMPTPTENRYNYDEYTESYSNETRYYKCTEVTYNESTGKVNSITFQQIIMEAIVEPE